MKRYSKELRGEVLDKIRSGQKVSAVARDYGLKENTVRNWLTRDTAGQGSELLEVSRLRRENEALYRLVGELTFEAEVEKKNRRREAGR